MTLRWEQYQAMHQVVVVARNTLPHSVRVPYFARINSIYIKYSNNSAKVMRIVCYTPEFCAIIENFDTVNKNTKLNLAFTLYLIIIWM